MKANETENHVKSMTSLKDHEKVVGIMVKVHGYRYFLKSWLVIIENWQSSMLGEVICYFRANTLNYLIQTLFLRTLLLFQKAI